MLQDFEKVRWTESEMLLWVADAQQILVHNIPDVASQTKNVKLTTGSTQKIPSDGIRLIRLVRNLGDGGNRPGPAITIVRRRDMDAVRPEWHSDRGREVTHYIYEPEVDRKTFWVYPSLRNAVYVEMSYALRPPLSVSAGDTLLAEDEWINAIVDWTLVRAFSKNADYGNNLARMNAHAQSFYQATGIAHPVRELLDPAKQIKGAP